MSGNVSDIRDNERLTLGDELLKNGIRLACQTVPQEDVNIIVLDPDIPTQWLDMPVELCEQACMEENSNLDIHAKRTIPDIGIALDIGTTHVSLCACELDSGRILARRWGPNPQRRFGADVVTRLINSVQGNNRAWSIARVLINGIGEAFYDISQKESVLLKSIKHVCITGNTAMLLLLTEGPGELLLRPENWTRPIHVSYSPQQNWRNIWGLSAESIIEIIPPLAGFIGSDAMVGMESLGIHHQPGSLFIDLGTNSETSLWDGEKLWMTSAAGGPAFEGYGIGCASPMQSGVVYRAEGLPHEPVYHTIDDGEPYGFCGTGLIDVIACLVSAGVLDEKGCFTENVPASGYPLVNMARKVSITKNDVDIIQRAKGAIGVAIRVLLEKAGMNSSDLQRICVCGAFGRWLNIENAQSIGLLPSTDPKIVELHGNTALLGCLRYMLSPNMRESLSQLYNMSQLVNLMACENFDEYFMDALFLKKQLITSTSNTIA